MPEADRPIFIVGMELGLRVQEVRALQWNCIHGNEINIKRSFRENELVETTKTGKARILPLSSFLWRVFSEIDRKLSPFIFTREDNKPYTNKNLNRIWRTACEKAGVKIKLQNALRHSLGCQLLDQGEELELVRDIYGHSKTDMTRRYAKRSTAPMADALDRRRKVIQFKKAKD